MELEPYAPDDDPPYEDQRGKENEPERRCNHVGDPLRPGAEDADEAAGRRGEQEGADPQVDPVGSIEEDEAQRDKAQQRKDQGFDQCAGIRAIQLIPFDLLLRCDG